MHILKTQKKIVHYRVLCILTILTDSKQTVIGDYWYHFPENIPVNIERSKRVIY